MLLLFVDIYLRSCIISTRNSDYTSTMVYYNYRNYLLVPYVVFWFLYYLVCMYSCNLICIILISTVLTQVTCLVRNIFASWEENLFLADSEITFYSSYAVIVAAYIHNKLFNIGKLASSCLKIGILYHYRIVTHRNIDIMVLE